MKNQIRDVKVKDLLKYYCLSLIVIILIVITFILLINRISLYILIPVTILILYYPLKYHAIGMVLAYKAFSPDSLRGCCRFQPTCSTFMIMAIKKYGLIIGVIKGIKRIIRCRPPNGGKDLP